MHGAILGEKVSSWLNVPFASIHKHLNISMVMSEAWGGGHVCCTGARTLLITVHPWLLLGSVSGAGEPEDILKLEEEEEFSLFCVCNPTMLLNLACGTCF